MFAVLINPSYPCRAVGANLTGPSMSGITRQIKNTLPIIKKKPRRVTMLGASHIGRSSTKAFHCISTKPSQQAIQQSSNPALVVEFCVGCNSDRRGGSYVVSQDIVGNEGLVHARVLVRLQGHQSLIRESFLGLCSIAKREKISLLSFPNTFPFWPCMISGMEWWCWGWPFC